MIRVNQAGEIGANWIYRGQLAVLGKDKEVGTLIEVGYRTSVGFAFG
jgi:ubiquinone biosynthesis monooxygenase Coq7